MSSTDSAAIWALLTLGYVFLFVSGARLLVGADCGYPGLLRASFAVSVAQVVSCLVIAAATA
ncbi:hypothetical protein [Nocardia sp. IFM 10818]